MKKLLDRTLSVVIVLLPFIMVVFIMLLISGGFCSKLIPVWSDEIVWWEQVKAMIEYGAPLGYIGYNGTHAPVGTWGTWGLAPILPYGIFGKLFGWKLYSMALANMTFLSIGLLIFLLLTKPNLQQKVYIVIMYVFMYITIGYSMTSMSEGLRYALGIILAGLLIWLERRTSDNNSNLTLREKILFFFFAVFIYYTIIVYLIFSLVVPLFCWYIFRRIRPLLRAVVSFILTCIIVVSANYLFSLTSAPYTTSTINDILFSFKEYGLLQGLCYALKIFFGNLATVKFSNLLVLLSDDSILFWFYLLYLCILFYLLYTIVCLIKKKIPMSGKNHCYVQAAWMMSGFLFGYCALYSGDKWTLCRGINAGLIMAFLFLIYAEKSTDKRILVAISLLSIASAYNYYKSMVEERASAAQYVDVINDESVRLNDVIDVSAQNSTWENTVAHYGNVTFMNLALPTGYGGNYMLNNKSNENAKYALIAKGLNEEIYKQTLTETGHIIIYEDDYFIVLLNADFL